MPQKVIRPSDKFFHFHAVFVKTPQDQADPPREADSAYGLRAAGTHPTGMHSSL